MQPADGFDTQARDRDRKLSRFVLHRVEPMLVRLRLGQQPVARTQRALERIDPAAVLGIDRERQPIEKPPPFRRRADEERIHRRRQPDHTHMIGEGGRGTHRLAIDPAFALSVRAIVGRALDAGAERCKPERALDLGGHRPGAVAFLEGHFVQRRTAQPASGREKRNRLDQVGFAGAVRSAQHDRPGVAGLNRHTPVVAEIAQRQAADEGHDNSF